MVEIVSAVVSLAKGAAKGAEIGAKSAETFAPRGQPEKKGSGFFDKLFSREPRPDMGATMMKGLKENRQAVVDLKKDKDKKPARDVLHDFAENGDKPNENESVKDDKLPEKPEENKQNEKDTTIEELKKRIVYLEEKDRANEKRMAEQDKAINTHSDRLATQVEVNKDLNNRAVLTGLNVGQLNIRMKVAEERLAAKT